ncbi:MAG: tRNA (guanosine(37)-N1)-methyltransferase TrmD [Acidiferrobacterales bacterium]
MRIDVVSIFPTMFDAVTDFGVTGRAVARGLLAVRVWDPRDYTEDRHRTVDDRPYGGGPGMVMLAEPLARAIEAARASYAETPRVAYLSPQGRRLNHSAIQGLARRPGLLLLAGRYEGVDERVLAGEVDEEWSIGDYVLSGGELAAMVMIDAIARQVPGVLGDADSAQQDSYAEGLLDCEHYTRPERWRGQRIPEVLLSGNHEEIRRWRLKRSLGRTWLRRPDLLEAQALDTESRHLLEEFKQEHAQESGARR